MRRNSLLVAGLLAISVTAYADQEIVQPETTTPVILSSTDVNRIVCTAGLINDVFYSKEKGMTITRKGNNAFVKYLIRVKGEAKTLVSQPTEIHVVCNNEVFTIIAKPERVQARTIRLASGIKGRMQENIATYGAMPFEQKVLMLTRAVYKDDIPEGFAVKAMSSKLVVKPTEAELKRIFSAIEVIKRREIRVEGLGMRLNEYTLNAKQKVQLHETDFLLKEFGAEIAGVTVHPLKLRAGQQGRLLIVEKVVN